MIYVVSRRSWLLGALWAFLAAFFGLPLSALAQTDALGDATPYQNWQVLLAFVLPLVVATVTKQSWSDGFKSAVMLVASAAFTAAGMWIEGTLDTTPVDVVAEILKVAVATIAFYYGIWKPAGTTAAIHRATG